MFNHAHGDLGDGVSGFHNHYIFDDKFEHDTFHGAQKLIFVDFVKREVIETV
jgi:hypothetical protein